MKLCGKYVGDNDATCPRLTCIRDRDHEGACDNESGDCPSTHKFGEDLGSSRPAIRCCLSTDHVERKHWGRWRDQLRWWETPTASSSLPASSRPAPRSRP